MTEFNKVFIDTAPFIYFLEGNPEYQEIVKKFILQCYTKNKEMITSTITIEEYCVFPFRQQDTSLIQHFESLIQDTGIQIIAIEKEIALKAAKIRAAYKSFKAMDSLQLATACISECDLFLTNDKQLKQFDEILCLTLDDL